MTFILIINMLRNRLNNLTLNLLLKLFSKLSYVFPMSIRKFPLISLNLGDKIMMLHKYVFFFYRSNTSIFNDYIN